MAQESNSFGNMGSSSGFGVDFSSIFNQLGSKVAQYTNQLSGLINSFDPGDAQGAFKLQYYVQQWTTLTTTQSNLSKAIYDTCKNTVSNIR